jgi:hypothetical protein
MFSIQELFCHRLKHYEIKSMHPLSSRAFQWYQKCGKRHLDLGDLNMTNKTNKQPSFHREIILGTMGTLSGTYKL